VDRDGRFAPHVRSSQETPEAGPSERDAFARVEAAPPLRDLNPDKTRFARLVWFKSTVRSLRSSRLFLAEAPEAGFEPEEDVLAHSVRCARLPGFKSLFEDASLLTMTRTRYAVLVGVVRSRRRPRRDLNPDKTRFARLVWFKSRDGRPSISCVRDTPKAVAHGIEIEEDARGGI
jgi:hypothetical protein